MKPLNNIPDLGKKAASVAKIAAGALVAGGAAYFGFAGARMIISRNNSAISMKRNSEEDESDFFETTWTSPNLTKQQRKAIKKSRELLKRFKNETGAPGVVVGVSVDGNPVWKEGLGYANLENGTPCHYDTAMRIASISKPITMALLAKVWEDGKIDLDKPIQEYISDFPVKKINGERVVITTRQLASHTSGIRHYTKKGEDKEKSDTVKEEFYIKRNFKDVKESLELFQNDELLFKPGTSFEYTTHGYTLLSAVLEKAVAAPFKDLIENLFRTFGMSSTYLDEVNTIIYNRSSYYSKNKKGKLINAELADTSYKWAGGGIVSTVGDLLKFGSGMLYCYQQTDNHKVGFLKRDTLMELWTPVKHSTMSWGKDAGYGLGWVVVPYRSDIGGLDEQTFYIGHGGGAVGASSVLLIVPKYLKNDESKEGSVNTEDRKLPKGVTVAILTNMQDVACHKIAKKIADQFQS